MSNYWAPPSRASFVLMTPIDDELWHRVGYHPQLQVSNFGRLRFKGEPDLRIRTTAIVERGPAICVNGTNTEVALLVMQAFVGDPPYGARIVHADGNRYNNRLPNLSYAV